MFCFHLQEHSPQPAIVKICKPGDEEDVGTSTDIDTDNIPEATGGTSTTKVEQVSVAKETTNGNVNRIIAMMTLDYPPSSTVSAMASRGCRPLTGQIAGLKAIECQRKFLVS